MERYFGENTPKLGFGLMRLPKRGGKIDITAANIRIGIIPGF